MGSNSNGVNQLIVTYLLTGSPFFGIMQLDSVKTVLKRLQKPRGLLNSQCIGIIIGKGSEKDFNSFMALFGEAVKIPPIGIAK